MKIQMCQISTDYINDGNRTKTVADRYYRDIWKKRHNVGFWKPHYFWEIPLWTAILTKNLPETELAVVKNFGDSIQKITQSDADFTVFSVLEANKQIVSNIIGELKNNIFVLGGCINFSSLKKGENYKVFSTLRQFVEYYSLDFTNEYDFKHFVGTQCIPRLELSSGCTNRCDYCTVEHNILERNDMKQQLDSFKVLDFKLIYLNDKTFGQTKNYESIIEAYDYVKQYNHKFDGFIIQTTPIQFLKLDMGFLEDSHIKFVELGIETFNDKILKKYHKPSTESTIIKATERLLNTDIWLIPNFIVGMPEETKQTYKRTIKYINDYSNTISHMNAYCLSVYENTPLSERIEVKSDDDLNENILSKTFFTDKKHHEWFYNELFNTGLELLDVNIK